MKQEKIWSYFQNSNEAKCFFSNAISRYKYIASLLSGYEKVLNIGVGAGGLESILINNSIDVYSLDPDEESINKLKVQLGHDGKAKVGYSQSIPFPSAMFDVVIMSEVLEHLSDDVIYLTMKEVRRVLKPSGKFIGTVPANEYLLDNRVVCPCCSNVFHRWGHVQSFGVEKLNNILSTQFEVVKITRKYFGNFNTLNWKGRIDFIFRVALVRLGFQGRSDSYLFIAKSHL